MSVKEKRNPIEILANNTIYSLLRFVYLLFMKQNRAAPVSIRWNNEKNNLWEKDNYVTALNNQILHTNRQLAHLPELTTKIPCWETLCTKTAVILSSWSWKVPTEHSLRFAGRSTRKIKPYGSSNHFQTAEKILFAICQVALLFRCTKRWHVCEQCISSNPKSDSG